MYEEYYERVREECLIRNRSSRTADVYVHNISHFMTWTGNKQMKDLTLQDARNFILDKRRSGAKASTCNFYNSSICFLYKHVLHIQWDQDTVPRMKLDKKLPETLTLEEIEKLIGQQVEWAALPENLVISDVLLDDEKVQTSNIVYQKGKPKGGGAFHAKSAKNSKTPQKVRKDRTKEGRRKK